MKKCAIIIVTYNRLELLKENVKAIMNLDGENFEVFYIDNASQDGTDKYLISKKNDKLHYFNTGSNLGGAGGFAYGIEKALKYKDKPCFVPDEEQQVPLVQALEILDELLDQMDEMPSRGSLELYDSYADMIKSIRKYQSAILLYLYDDDTIL